MDAVNLRLILLSYCALTTTRPFESTSSRDDSQGINDALECEVSGVYVCFFGDLFLVAGSPSSKVAATGGGDSDSVPIGPCYVFGRRHGIVTYCGISTISVRKENLSGKYLTLEFDSYVLAIT